MANYTPFEIQAEIMKNLPTKSLMQFRSVSKQLKSLIASSEFIADYSFKHTQQQHLLVAYRESFNSEQKYVSFVDDDSFPQKKLCLPAPLTHKTPNSNFPHILGSSHGLFCLYTYSYGSSADVSMIKPAVIWNPSIRKSVSIVVSDMIEPMSDLHIGFGVCPHTRDPKIVKIEFRYCMSNLNTLIATPWQFEVYSLSSRVWRSIPAINQFNQSTYLRRRQEQVVIDGFIYWLALSEMMTLESRILLIVSFDITAEKFVEVSLPNTLARSYCTTFLSELKESLIVVEVVHEAETQFYGVWMMDPGVPNTFTKLYTIIKPETSLQPGLLGYKKNNEHRFQMRSTDSDTEDLVVTKVNSEHNNHVAISWKGVYLYVKFYTESLLLHDY